MRSNLSPLRKIAFVLIVFGGASLLGVACLVAAFVAGSRREAAQAARQTAWIRSNAFVGMKRPEVYRLLRSRGLFAFNYDYIVAKSSGMGDCDYSDRSTGGWPYQGEPFPKEPPDCGSRDAWKGNPNAQVVLAAGYDRACGKWIFITLRFDDRDRMRRVEVEPDRVCE